MAGKKNKKNPGLTKVACFEYLIELGGGDAVMGTKAEIRLWGAGWIAERRPCITETCVPGELERHTETITISHESNLGTESC